MYPLNSPTHSPSFIPGQGAHPAVGGHSPHNPFAPSAPPLPLFDLDAPVPAPSYPTIDSNGRVTHRPPVRTRTGDRMEAFPVASTIDAARNYIDTMNAAEGALATGNRLECPASVLKFQRSTKFSDVQKQGIQEYYDKYSMPIGIAHQLEDLVGYRFEFILDDHKETPIKQFNEMKREICKRVELLRHIPNAGITIRTSSEYNKPLTFQVNEERSTQVFQNIEEHLRFLPLARHTPSFQQVYETSVGDAVHDGVPTIPYVFSARDLTKDSKDVKRLAKNLTKAVVNRPEEMAPTAFYPHSENETSNAIINNLDTMAKKVGVIRPFQKEYDEVRRQQSEIFPFSEGCYSNLH